MYATDYIRNSVLGHIMFDFRIACAMHNFSHKPIMSDGEKIEDYCKILLRRSTTEINPYNFLIHHQFNTSLFPRVDEKKVNDFPIVEKEILKDKFFLGSFLYRLIKSYLFDFAHRNELFCISNKLIRKLKDEDLKWSLINTTSHIVGCFVKSRHKKKI